jgi:hypothetical protein
LPGAEEPGNILDFEDLAASMPQHSAPANGATAPVFTPQAANVMAAMEPSSIGELTAPLVSLGDSSAAGALQAPSRPSPTTLPGSSDLAALFASPTSLAAGWDLPDGAMPLDRAIANLSVTVQEEEGESAAVDCLAELGMLADLQAVPASFATDASEPAAVDATIPLTTDASATPLPWIVGVMSVAACEIARRQMKGPAKTGEAVDPTIPAWGGPPGLAVEGQP